MEPTLRLFFACCDYDHVRDLLNGRIRAEGLALDHVRLLIAEIFRHFTHDREWDLSEMSMGALA